MNRILLIIGGAVALVLLAGGAFVGARLLSTSGEVTTSIGGNVNIIAEEGGSTGNFAISINLKPAPELPTTPPETGGVFVRQEDNSIFVGTGDIEVTVDVEEGGSPTTNVDYSGPVLEVVTTRDTVLYRDQTEFPTPSQGTSGEQTVQQIVNAVDSLDELDLDSQNAEVQVWGNRSGDRVVAQVLVYRSFDR